MLFLRRSLIGVLLMALSFGALIWAAASVYTAVTAMLDQTAPPPPNREIILSVNSVVLRQSSETPVMKTFGEIESRRTLDVRATAEGRVIWLSRHFENGGRIAAGDPLMQIDPAQAKADLALARADLTEAQGDLAEAIRSVGLAQDDLDVAREQASLRGQILDRQTDLQARGFGSGTAVETAALDAAASRQAVVSRRQALAQSEARIDQEQARLSRMEIALAEAERLLADTDIRAQFSGTLSGVSVVEGGLVSRNEQLAQLVDPEDLQVMFRLSTAQYARLVPAENTVPDAAVEVVMDVAGLDVSARGEILRESAVVGAGQTGRQLFARLDAAVGFRPGDIVTVLIRERPLAQVARLPALAVDSAGNVLVIGADQRLTEVPVEVLRRQDDMVLVRALDLEGADVVAERTPLLGAGIKVRSFPMVGGPDKKADPDDDADQISVSLTDERRKRLIDYVTHDSAMKPDARARVLVLLSRQQVPETVVLSLEQRMGS